MTKPTIRELLDKWLRTPSEHRQREVHAQVVEGLRQAREGWAKERAEVERLREALRRLLDYTEQIEQLAYDISEQIEIHPIVAEARAALRGEGEK